MFKIKIATKAKELFTKKPVLSGCDGEIIEQVKKRKVFF